MKKLLLLAACAFMVSTAVLAKQEKIDFSVSIIDDKPAGNLPTRSPMEPPSVSIEDGDVVYSAVVTSAQTTVVLPSTLSGGYVIELVMGNWLFTGYIML